MSGRMRWDKVTKLHGRQTLDHRREFEFEDSAAKWLRRAESKRQRAVSIPAKVQRRTMAILQQLGESSNWVTADSSAEVPW
jgi:hypothetical protein